MPANDDKANALNIWRVSPRRPPIAKGATGRPRLMQTSKMCVRYWIALPTCEKMFPAFDPISRIVPTTMTRTTAIITEYSAMS